MLVRLLNGRGTIVPVALVTFLASTLGLPAVSVAQTSGAKASVLMVPIQRGPGVPESVPVRAQEMLSALLGIEPGVKLTLADVGPEEVPEQLLAVADETPVVEVASPQVGHPDLDKADKLAATGIDHAKAGRYEKALTVLMQAKGLYERRVAYLDDFDKMTSTLAWIAASFANGGFSEEAGPAVRALLAVRPDFVPSAEEFGQRGASAIEGAKGRLARGAKLTLNVQPDDALVFVNGNFVGKGSQVLEDLPKGVHYVKVTKGNAEPTSRKVNVTSSSTAKLAVKDKVVKETVARV